MELPLAKHEIIAFVLAFVGGFGGLTASLAHSTMVDALNELRPPDDRIPVLIVTPSDFLKRRFRSEFGYWRLAKEFHARYPNRSTYYWCIGGSLCMLLFFAAMVVSFFAFR